MMKMKVKKKIIMKKNLDMNMMNYLLNLKKNMEIIVLKEKIIMKEIKNKK